MKFAYWICAAFVSIGVFIIHPLILEKPLNFIFGITLNITSIAGYYAKNNRLTNQRDLFEGTQGAEALSRHERDSEVGAASDGGD